MEYEAFEKPFLEANKIKEQIEKARERDEMKAIVFLAWWFAFILAWCADTEICGTGMVLFLADTIVQGLILLIEAIAERVKKSRDRR